MERRTRSKTGDVPKNPTSSIAMGEDTLRSELDEGQPCVRLIEHPLPCKYDETQPSVQLCQGNETMEIESNETSPIPHQAIPIRLYPNNPAIPIQDAESVPIQDAEPTIQLLKEKLKKSDKKIEMLKKKL